jgi:hypothetical protein
MLVSEQYKPQVIKEYTYWTLLIHEMQLPFLGRCVVWWKDRSLGDGEGMRYSDIQPEAHVELGMIEGDILDAWQALGHTTEPYGADFRVNMSLLANMQEHHHHLHWHFVPRFKHPVDNKALGLYVEDGALYRNYPNQKQSEVSPAVLQSIRAVMAKAINGIV